MKISITKKNYFTPKVTKVGKIAKLTLKTGSVNDAGLPGFI